MMMLEKDYYLILIIISINIKKCLVDKGIKEFLLKDKDQEIRVLASKSLAKTLRLNRN